jgi:hypothetical protein
MEISCPPNTVEISPSPFTNGQYGEEIQQTGYCIPAHDHRRNDLSHKSVELRKLELIR